MTRDVQQAVEQVRLLKALVLERGFFRGYSGHARLVAGSIAVCGAAVMSSHLVASTPEAHLVGWALVLVLSLTVDYGALAYWFVSRSPRGKRDVAELAPALDAMPGLAVGALLSLALIRSGQFDLLPGTWLSLYGIAQIAYRHSLPRWIHRIGMLYVLCGAALFLFPNVSFTDPWPLGIAFLLGEWAGGLVLIYDNALRTRKDQRAEEV